MFLPLQADVADYAEQRRPWTVYVLLCALMGCHAVLYLVLSDSERMLAFVRWGAVRFIGREYMPLTCTLVHGGLLHLVGNMLFLWIYGGGLERSIGWWRFLVLYVLGAYISIEVQYWTMGPTELDNPIIGASGAISALMGAFLVLMPTSKIDTLFFSVVSFRPIHVRIPAWFVLGLWFLGQLLYSSGFVGEMEGVAFWAHVGGFVGGAVLGTLLKMTIDSSQKGYVTKTREPLIAGWKAFLAGDRVMAHDWAAAPVLGAQGSQWLLAGVSGPPEERLPRLLTGFAQAREYRNAAQMMTIYLQLLKLDVPVLVPSDVHAEAGFTAQGLKETQLALTAFHYAILTGEEERLEKVLRALEGMLEHRLKRADLAERVARVRQGE